MSEDNPYHWQEQDQVFTNNNVVVTGKKIVSMGQPPMNVVNINGAVTLKGMGQGQSRAVRVLDENGYDRGSGSSQIIGSDLKITLPTNSLYTVVLKDVNSAPMLMVPPDQEIKALSTMTVTNYASDADIPANMLTFALVSAPQGVVLDPVTGVLMWTPTQGQGPSTNVIVVKVSDDGSPSLSATNSFTVVVVVQTPPTIISQPQSQAVTMGGSATFSVVATGSTPLTYQWQFNGANLNGATSSSLTLNSVQTANAGSYSVVVANGAGSATSASAVLTVNPVVVMPVITVHPQSQTVSAGQSATLSVTAAGTPPLSYQWQKDGASVSGAISATLVLNNVQASDAGAYRVVINNAAGSVTSAIAMLTVIPVITGPEIVTQPQSRTSILGSTEMFIVVATGNGPFSYQWQKNGAAISGATNASLILNNVQAADSGVYRVMVSNSFGSAVSQDAVLSLVADPNSGAVIFNNRVIGTVDVRVLLPDGTPAGAGWTAQLYGGPEGGAWSPLFPATSFRTPSTATLGYVVPVDVTVPGVAPGAKATLVMRVYNGSSFENSTVRLESNPFTVVLGGGTLPPPNLEGLKSFRNVSNEPPRLSSLTLLPNGELRLSVSGQAGASYVIEVSSDLVSWTVLGTVTETGGVLLFRDAIVGSPQRFYRVAAN